MKTFKRILVIALFVLFNSVLFAQNSPKSIEIDDKVVNEITKITLKDGTTFNCIIQSIESDSITYSDLNIQNWKTISKSEISNLILLSEGFNDKSDINNQSIYSYFNKKPKMNNQSIYSFDSNSAGDYLIQASNSYLYGIGLGLVGCTFSVVGASIEGAEPMVYMGAGLALSGFVCIIVGHTKLKKAGQKLNENKSISFKPASSGIGLALNF